MRRCLAFKSVLRTATVHASAHNGLRTLKNGAWQKGCKSQHGPKRRYTKCKHVSLQPSYAQMLTNNSEDQRMHPKAYAPKLGAP